MGNNCHDEYGIKSLERFLSTKGHARVKQFHTSGLPCFILDPKNFKRNRSQNGHPDRDRPFILVYRQRMQEVLL